MSCCGKKRKEWLQETKSPANPDTTGMDTNFVVVEKPDKIFEYTGNRSLTVKGSVTGKLYYFRYNGYRLKVGYIDSLALMAERDLRVIGTNNTY
jgi:hypothetical protein